MKKMLLLLSLISILSFSFLSQCTDKDNPDKTSDFKLENKTTQQSEDYQLSEPITYKNLSIYLIYGEDQIKNKKFLTLQEAMEQKKVVVHETGNVQELFVENVSQDEDIYILSGDIVKGGKQDRVLTYDYVLSPKSGKVNVSSFCVESGRWAKRENENLDAFSSSKKMIASKDLKLSAKKYKDQSKVWSSVATTQNKLEQKLNKKVKSEKSESSLQLTLENKDVKQATEKYTKAFAKLLVGKKNVIGYSFAINGKVNSSDIFANSELFKKLWPKLLESSIVEAIQESEKGKQYTAPKVTNVIANLKDAETGKKKKKELTQRVTAIEKESDNNYLLETTDKKSKDKWFRKNYITK